MSEIWVVKFDDGYAICGDSTTVEMAILVFNLVGLVPLIIADPPYGNVVDEDWDRFEGEASAFCALMVAWTRLWAILLYPGGGMYVWGGIGKPGFRPFLRYLHEVEAPDFQLSSLITWAKKRAYGIQHGYLFCREECGFFIKGNPKKPRLFNVPLLETLRGYKGYDEAHPALSPFYRRTNVWMDVTEILRGKKHIAQKPPRVFEIPIEVHTEPGEYVIDPFAGYGTTAFACRKLGRKFVVIEKDPADFAALVERLQTMSMPATTALPVEKENG